jgi:hypothetical protein
MSSPTIGRQREWIAAAVAFVAIVAVVVLLLVR